MPELHIPGMEFEREQQNHPEDREREHQDVADNSRHEQQNGCNEGQVGGSDWEEVSNAQWHEIPYPEERFNVQQQLAGGDGGAAVETGQLFKEWFTRGPNPARYQATTYDHGRGDWNFMFVKGSRHKLTTSGVVYTNRVHNHTPQYAPEYTQVKPVCIHRNGLCWCGWSNLRALAVQGYHSCWPGPSVGAQEHIEHTFQCHSAHCGEYRQALLRSYICSNCDGYYHTLRCRANALHGNTMAAGADATICTEDPSDSVETVFVLGQTNLGLGQANLATTTTHRDKERDWLDMGPQIEREHESSDSSRSAVAGLVCETRELERVGSQNYQPVDWVDQGPVETVVAPGNGAIQGVSPNDERKTIRKFGPRGKGRRRNKVSPRSLPTSNEDGTKTDQPPQSPIRGEATPVHPVVDVRKRVVNRGGRILSVQKTDQGGGSADWQSGPVLPNRRARKPKAARGHSRVRKDQADWANSKYGVPNKRKERPDEVRSGGTRPADWAEANRIPEIGIRVKGHDTRHRRNQDRKGMAQRLRINKRPIDGQLPVEQARGDPGHTRETREDLAPKPVDNKSVRLGGRVGMASSSVRGETSPRPVDWEVREDVPQRSRREMGASRQFPRAQENVAKRLPAAQGNASVQPPKPAKLLAACHVPPQRVEGGFNKGDDGDSRSPRLLPSVHSEVLSQGLRAKKGTPIHS